MAKNVKLKEKTYEIEDPTDFFLDLFSFRKENKSYFPEHHWELVLGAIIGGMGSGKSTLLQFLATLGKKLYGSEFVCYHTDDLIYLLKYLNKNQEKRKKVMFFFLDDALTKPGADSRRAMSADNVKASQNLSIIRHLLANEDDQGNPDPRFKNGFCAIFYAVQDPNRLDPFIRRNLHITLYKTHYDSLDKTLDADNLQFIKDVTEDSMYRHNYEARGYALGITKTGGCLRMYFPRSQVSIPIVYTEGTNYEEIIDHLLHLDLDEIKDSILKGLIREYCYEHKIDLDKTDLSEIVEIARYRWWKMNQEKGKEQEDRAQNQLREIERKMKCATIHECLAQGKTIEEICKKISKTKSWYEYHYPRWCQEMGIQPIRIKKIRKKLKELQKIIPTEEE